MAASLFQVFFLVAGVLSLLSPLGVEGRAVRQSHFAAYHPTTMQETEEAKTTSGNFYWPQSTKQYGLTANNDELEKEPSAQSFQKFTSEQMAQDVKNNEGTESFLPELSSKDDGKNVATSYVTATPYIPRSYGMSDTRNTKYAYDLENDKYKFPTTFSAVESSNSRESEDSPMSAYYNKYNTGAFKTEEVDQAKLPYSFESTYKPQNVVDDDDAFLP